MTEIVAQIHKGGLSKNLRFVSTNLLLFFYKSRFVKTRRNASYDAHKPRFVDKPPFVNSGHYDGVGSVITT